MRPCRCRRRSSRSASTTPSTLGRPASNRRRSCRPSSRSSRRRSRAPMATSSCRRAATSTGRSRSSRSSGRRCTTLPRRTSSATSRASRSARTCPSGLGSSPARRRSSGWPSRSRASRPIGPWVVSLDEFDDPNDLAPRLQHRRRGRAVGHHGRPHLLDLALDRRAVEGARVAAGRPGLHGHPRRRRHGPPAPALPPARARCWRRGSRASDACLTPFV